MLLLAEQLIGFQCLLQAYFRPELLNRLDETVVFRQLSRVDIATISQLVLQQTSDRLADKGVLLDVSQAVLARIQEEGYDEVGWMLQQHRLPHAAQSCLGAVHGGLVHDPRSEVCAKYAAHLSSTCSGLAYKSAMCGADTV